jgi:CDP-diacylglycerol--inositol 3-phosphatidyltransferase
VPLCARLSQDYALFYLALVALDIGAHWAQMYASLLSRAASHKDVGAAKWALLRVYYSKRIFMGMLCVGAEVFYMVRFVTMLSACIAAREPPHA